MFHIIAKLQRQSFQIRKQVALIVSGIIVFIIAVIWIGTFNTRLTPNVGTEVIVTEIKNDTAPFSLLKEQFNDLRSLFLNKPEF